MTRVLCVIALAGGLAGCADAPTAPTEVGQVLASVQGSVSTLYQGTGQFSVGSARIPQRPKFFILRSADVATGGREALIVQRLGADLPEPGEYALGTPGGFVARYERTQDGVREGYTADAGTLEITSATPTRIEGSFRFSAVRHCTGSRNAMTCQVPPPADAPRIEVEGSFVAVAG